MFNFIPISFVFREKSFLWCKDMSTYDSIMNMKLAEADPIKKKQLEEKVNKFKERTYKTFKKEINQRGCIGSISELYDSKMPFEPKGAFAQAWSVAEVFRIIF